MWRAVLSDVLSTTKADPTSSPSSRLHDFWLTQDVGLSGRSRDALKILEKQLMENIAQISSLIDFFDKFYDPTSTLSQHLNVSTQEILNLENDRSIAEQGMKNISSHGMAAHKEYLDKLGSLLTSRRQALEPIAKFAKGFMCEFRYVDIGYNLKQIARILAEQRSRTEAQKLKARAVLKQLTLETLDECIEDLKNMMASDDAQKSHLDLLHFTLQVMKEK